MYCEYCGEVLLKSQQTITRYNAMSGAPYELLKVHSYCPKFLPTYPKFLHDHTSDIRYYEL